jgi:SAM-dependent methyltransferase
MSSPAASPAPVAHGLEAPSAWVQRWTHLVKAHGTVLDLACGHGRHMKWFASQGHSVTGVDRSPEAIAAVGPLGEAIVADIENGPWPLTKEGQIRQFDAVVVTNYLWRALFPVILESLAPDGVLIYETFATGNEKVGKPSRPEFLLQPGELLRAFAGLRVVAFEDGFIAQPERFVQRMAAVKPAVGLSTNSAPMPYLL